MSKIRYPDEKRIKKEIREIIRKSDMFNDSIEGNDDFEDVTEYVPIASSRRYVKTVAAIATAAAVCMVAAGVGHYINLNNSDDLPEPLNNVVTEEEQDYTIRDITSDSVLFDCAFSGMLVKYDGMSVGGYNSYVESRKPKWYLDDFEHEYMARSWNSSSDKYDMLEEISCMRDVYQITETSLNNNSELRNYMKSQDKINARSKIKKAVLDIPRDYIESVKENGKVESNEVPMVENNTWRCQKVGDKDIYILKEEYVMRIVHECYNPSGNDAGYMFVLDDDGYYRYRETLYYYFNFEDNVIININEALSSGTEQMKHNLKVITDSLGLSENADIIGELEKEQ
ncbi:MAG: hypothetical protein Q4F06_04135 [Eubacteriales bacterium]|nr:hypothetical protein [Eubacteriales bacterium]